MIKLLEYNEKKQILKITFRKGKFRHSGQVRELSDTSFEIYRNLIGAESVGRAVIELLGERKYIKSQTKKKSLFSRLLDF